MTEINWAERWKESRQALLAAVDFQIELGGEAYDRDLIADFVEENDFGNALLFATGVLLPDDTRPRARELAELLIPQAEFLIEYERQHPTDPSPLTEYGQALGRLKAIASPAGESPGDEAG